MRCHLHANIGMNSGAEVLGFVIWSKVITNVNCKKEFEIQH